MSFIPIEKQKRFVARLSKLKRPLIVAFCVFHVVSVLWWLIPNKFYNSGERDFPAFSWLAKTEDKLIGWKKRRGPVKKWLASILEGYSFFTSSYQGWGMFAPNPSNTNRWLVSYPVIGWRHLDKDEALLHRLPWKQKIVPIYDPNPVYRGYENELLADRMIKSNLFYDYRFKIGELVTRANRTDVYRAISNWSLKQYLKTHKRRPHGFHVLKIITPLSKEFNPPPDFLSEFKPVIAFYHHYK